MYDNIMYDGCVLVGCIFAEMLLRKPFLPGMETDISQLNKVSWQQLIMLELWHQADLECYANQHH
jgi:hypothetical protein